MGPHATDKACVVDPVLQSQTAGLLHRAALGQPRGHSVSRGLLLTGKISLVEDIPPPPNLPAAVIYLWLGLFVSVQTDPRFSVVSINSVDYLLLQILVKNALWKLLPYNSSLVSRL